MTVRNGAVNSKPLVIVSGPTASGKSSYAVELARKINAEIINIDSVQVFKEFNIGAAKMSEEEMQGVRHHLIDVLDPSEICNVARYCSMAKAAIDDIRSRGRQVIIAGGTTMYITCLLQGLDELPDSDPATRKKLEDMELHELVQKLSECDPESAKKISPNDKVRLVRALEAFMLSGKPASAARQAHLQNQKQDYAALILLLSRPRKELYERINNRVSEMLSNNLIEETKYLSEKYGSSAQGLKSLGYAQVLEYLNGSMQKEDLKENISMLTRRFAKRQLTYWRNEPEKRNWKVRFSEEEALCKGHSELADEVNTLLLQGIDQTEVWYVSM